MPLYRNAYALMLNTVVNSGLGLLYWVVAARSFTDAEVGRGNALVSLMLLVSTLTQLNWGNALIRFLPRAGAGSRRLVVSAYGIGSGVAAAVAVGVTAWCHLAHAPGDPLWVSVPFAAWFVVSTVAWSVFALQDSALTGLRAAHWIPLENGLYGLVKLVLLVAVAHTSLSDGVFTSWSAPVLALLVPVNLLLFRRVLPRHAAETDAEAETRPRGTITRYMAGDYTGQLFNQLSSTFLPVLVVERLGAAQGAYFLPAQTIFAAMGMLAMAITSSLVVEAAKDPAHAARHARSVLRRLCLTVLPGAAVVIVVAPFVLLLFGQHYREGATATLQLMMLSLFPRMVVSLYVTKVRLENRTVMLALMQGVQAVLIIGATALFAPVVGLVAAGWGAVAAEVVPAAFAALPVVRWLREGDRVSAG